MLEECTVLSILFHTAKNRKTLHSLKRRRSYNTDFHEDFLIFVLVIQSTFGGTGLFLDILNTAVPGFLIDLTLKVKSISTRPVNADFPMSQLFSPFSKHAY
jgi:hypothetical protein